MVIKICKAIALHILFLSNLFGYFNATYSHKIRIEVAINEKTK